MSCDILKNRREPIYTNAHANIGAYVISYLKEELWQRKMIRLRLEEKRKKLTRGKQNRGKALG